MADEWANVFTAKRGSLIARLKRSAMPMSAQCYDNWHSLPNRRCRYSYNLLEPFVIVRFMVHNRVLMIAIPEFRTRRVFLPAHANIRCGFQTGIHRSTSDSKIVPLKTNNQLPAPQLIGELQKSYSSPIST